MKPLLNHLIAILIGISAGLVTIFVVPSRFEIIIWLIVIPLLAYTSKRLFNKSTFKHVFLFSITSGISITATHLIFLKKYLESHSDETPMLEQITLYDSYYVKLVLIAPVYWLLLGILSGGFSLLLGNLKQRH